MGEQTLELLDPTEALAEAYRQFVGDYRAAKERVVPGSGERDPMFDYSVWPEDFPAFVQRLRDAVKGEGLPVGYVPCSTYWLVRNGQTILGTSNLRHQLTPMLLEEGGHIGYSIRPSERRKGYGTLILRLTLERARQLGITRALVTCDHGNIASAGVIRNNGGVFQDEVPLARGKIKHRYWIDL